MVYLIRHGQTDWNLLKKFNGITDTELNQIGIEQARQQEEKLRNVNFDACFCSLQKRARQTCEVIYKGPIFFDDRLTEINCGEFEGTEETADSLKLFWQAVRSGDKGTEIFKKFTKRNCDFCGMITEEYKGKDILIVTHAANARVINYYFTGKSPNYDFGKAIAVNGEILKYKN